MKEQIEKRDFNPKQNEKFTAADLTNETVGGDEN